MQNKKLQIHQLAKTPIFSILNNEEMNELENIIDSWHLKKGEMLFEMEKSWDYK